ncbi:MAG: aldo/keto reductase [Gammaproteobacteria bacterium]|nr:aldo/keto reductase [Gammaproteobacteria bacterium]NIR85030.1 aldo/keto reductase [Gammaproteobacteria bacterium]NIR88297.1 aldo/keto reductase [Gammaproteobacteria bacterium]NIU06077.1 aldo/keto reductase [Gammaproteobacteria bacterium]NIV73496.1 aldo/keto reductase [Gammaproteobacteria bacterium]
MEYRRLGSTGLKVSRICLGAMTYGTPEWRDWILTEEEGRPFIQRALELGINFFDTADMYSNGVSEEILGRALKDFARREEVVVATKVYMPTGESPNDRGLSRKHIIDAIDASLRRLGTDYVDLYQIHRWDKDTPIEETMEALHDVVKAGKALYIGASTMCAWQFAKAQHVAERNGWTRFATMQPMYNLIYREEEREMLPLCADQGVGVIPWSPLGRGLLAGTKPPGSEGETLRARTDELMDRWRLGQAADHAIIEAVQARAAERGVPPAQVALAWVLSKPVVTAPIVGASKMQHLDDAVGALEIALSEADIERLEAPYVPHEPVGYA